MTDLMEPPGGWAGAVPVRIAVPPVPERGLLLRAVSRLSVLFGRDQVPDIFPVLHRHPLLFWTWLLFASRLMPFGRLPADVREKLILRTGWNCRSRYEWGQHVDVALTAGVADADILRVAQGPQAFADPLARALMQACDELCRDHVIADATWRILATRYDEPLRIEITMLVGHYQMVAGFLNSTGITLEPALEEKLQAFYRRVAVPGP